MTDAKRPRLYIDVLLTAVAAIAIPVYNIGRHHYSYKAGLTNFSDWTIVLGFWSLMLALFAFVLLTVLIVRGFIFNVKFGIKRLLLQIFFVYVLICLFFIVPRFIRRGYTVFTEGYLERIKKDVDIASIQTWTESVDLESLNPSEIYESTLLLDEPEWPEEIKKKFPPDRVDCVYVKKSKNGKVYVRVMFGGVLAGYWGFVVGESAEEIPLNDLFTSEYRRELGPNAFVWYRLRYAD